MRICKLLLLTAALLGLCCPGCTDLNKDPYAAARRPEQPRSTGPAYIDPTAVAVRDDIVSIQSFWNTMPWLIEQVSGRAIGFRVLTYFVSRETEKGAFVSNPVVVTMYDVRLTADGQALRTPLHTWELDQAAATGFRVRKRAIGGYYYGFVLKWPEHINPSGRRIEVQIAYTRSDGVQVQATPRALNVPAPAVRLPHAASPAPAGSVRPLPPGVTPAPPLRRAPAASPQTVDDAASPPTAVRGRAAPAD